MSAPSLSSPSKASQSTLGYKTQHAEWAAKTLSGPAMDARWTPYGKAPQLTQLRQTMVKGNWGWLDQESALEDCSDPRGGWPESHALHQTGQNQEALTLWFVLHRNDY